MENEVEDELCRMRTCRVCGEVKPRNSAFQRTLKLRLRMNGTEVMTPYYARTCKPCQSAAKAERKGRQGRPRGKVSWLPGEALSASEAMFFCQLGPTEDETD